jgi:hypothetical protein
VRTRLAAQTPRDTAHYTGIGGTLARVVAEEGVAGLYRGLGATLMQVGGGFGGLGGGGRGWSVVEGWGPP